MGTYIISDGIDFFVTVTNEECGLSDAQILQKDCVGFGYKKTNAEVSDDANLQELWNSL